uniref:heat shock 70 kDa protein II-like n=1 Tax=Styela clava TaxID=7725 RepID=UPI001939A896|nr:heat shock 70 kDa protein II-like [Styela clava]
MTSIGIDFGTSYCCVAIHRNGKTEVIPNEHDQRLTPSYIAFTEDERLFGDAAQHQTPLNLKNTLYQIKSLVGRTSDDDIVRKHEKYWGFDVNHNSSKNEIEIPITFRGKDFELNPVQVTAMIFENLKEMANNYIGEKVDNAVISVPACFHESQRIAIQDAGFVSGFKNVELINEPSAAALAFARNQNNPAKRVVLIFDIGAGKFDTGIYDVDVNGESIKRVLGETGNSSFGGDDFDYELVDHILQSAGNITPDKKAIYRLKKSCEKAKKSLSSAKRARLQIDRFVGDDSYNQVLMVDEFEKVSSTEFEEIEKVLSDVLKVADITKEQVNDIVLVGGSTRIPKIRKILSDFFDGKTLNQTVNPDEAVACGAAIYAADNILKNSKIEETAYVMLIRIFGRLGEVVETLGSTKMALGVAYLGFKFHAKLQTIHQNAIFSKEDEDLWLLNEKRNELENYIYRVKENVKSSSNIEIGRDEAKLFLKNCDDTLIWLNEHQDATLSKVEKMLDGVKRAFEDMQQPKGPKQEDDVYKCTAQAQFSGPKFEDIHDNGQHVSAHGVNGQKSDIDIDQSQSKSKIAARRAALGSKSKGANRKSTPVNPQVQKKN